MLRVVLLALAAVSVIGAAGGTALSAAGRPVRAPQIAFYRTNDAGEGWVYLVSSDGTRLTRVARGGPTPCDPDDGDERSLDWSADGRLLVFTIYDSGNDVSKVEVVTPGSRPRTIVSESSYLGPRISPNGRFVAYCYETNPEARDDSMLVNLANVTPPARERTISDAQNENAFEPAWSPRSDEIAYVNLGELVIVTPTGRRKAVVKVNAANPDWSPSGARIAYATPRGIETVRPDGKGRLRVAGLPHAADPVWSPGGRTIAFSAGPEGSRAIYEANPDGSGVRRMTARTLDAIEPVWSPDGTKLAFAVPGKGIWVASATRANDAKRITRGNDLSPAWRPR